MKISFFFLIISLSFTSSHWCGYRDSWGGRFGPEQKNDMDITYQYQPESEYNFMENIFVPDGFGPPRPRSESESVEGGLNPYSGVFTAPEAREYLVTVTASLLPPYIEGFAAYAQIFLMKNNMVKSLEDYMIVEVNGKSAKVSDMRRIVHLKKGDQLKLYVGHHQSKKHRWMASGGIETVSGFNLQDIRFCIF